jgi:hypothetical protein
MRLERARHREAAARRIANVISSSLVFATSAWKLMV